MSQHNPVMLKPAVVLDMTIREVFAAALGHLGELRRLVPSMMPLGVHDTAIASAQIELLASRLANLLDLAEGTVLPRPPRPPKRTAIASAQIELLASRLTNMLGLAEGTVLPRPPKR